MRLMNRPAWLRYGMAVVSVGVFLLLVECLFHPLVGEGPPLLLFLTTVMFSAWYGGLRPGLLAVILAAIVCNLFYFPPLMSLGIDSSNDAFRLAVFITEGVLISSLMAELHAA